MERQLRQCPCCKEWFNTTTAIMIEHYKSKHEFATNKAFEIARLAASAALLAARSKIEPFPKSMMTAVEARMIQGHILVVLSSTPNEDSYLPKMSRQEFESQYLGNFTGA